MIPFKESDWKVFKKIRPLALDRFCKETLCLIAGISDSTDKTFHEKYLAIYALMRERDEDLAAMFSDFRRSRAHGQITYMIGRDLLTEEEIQQFSEEEQEAIGSFRK